MKLPIRKEYFDQIKAGKKDVEFRDAHITFECIDDEGNKTGETIRKYVSTVGIVPKRHLPKEYQDSDMFEDDKIIRFALK